MRNTIIIAVISLVILAGCSKDKFSSTPKLTFKSVNANVFNKGESMQIKLGFTDLEGDLEDSIYVEKVEPTCSASSFNVMYKLPTFPVVKNSEGELIISYTYGSTSGPFLPLPGPGCGRNDTCYFRFMLKDKAQHKSDTVNTESIVLIN